MILSRSPTDTLRSEGCTLTGVLSVTGFLKDAVTVIHGPSGCTHHNVSLLHASLAEIDEVQIPCFLSSNIHEEEVIFGGEKALLHALDAAEARDSSLICVVSTCIADTIGDDIAALCSQKRSVPVIHIPGAGFLGGGFSEGIRNALSSLLNLAEADDMRSDDGVLIVGEKNLEYEVEENFREVSCLLSLLDLAPGIRFVRKASVSDCRNIGSAPATILRAPSLQSVGSLLRSRFGMSVIPGFPVGPDGSIRFLEDLGDSLGVDPRPAIRDAEGMVADLYTGFDDLRDTAIRLDCSGADPATVSAARSVLHELRMKEASSGVLLPLPFDPPVGIAGTRRMLHSWRRCLSRA
ncbi:MAG: Oxidoreductase/nitrogenase, component 1 [Methanomicrobiales archaeon 53_19]|nr:MAG: Oxidoreductase/nitrogenase, component 1 [Methanocalculus sp. 52_23]KUL03520.1 MAG: Oxidoreductase/nitrogenase, component 1 [Methanomicrobiales archaeon 53_19]